MKRILLSLFTLLCFSIIAITLSSSSNGITGQSSAGCTCHGSQNSATVLSLTGFPSNYVLGQAYPITVSVTNASKLAGGFDLTVSAGSISAGSAGTTTQPTLKEIGHNAPKSFTSGTCSWTFTWTAPSSGTAAITVNFAGNAVDLANGSNGDVWNKTTLTVAAPLVAPTVTATTSAILCNGGTSTITCTGTGGTTPYQYKLNAGAFQSSNVFTGNVAGIYTITIKGANSATSSTVKTITQPSIISLTAGSTNVSCFGGTNGSASVVATGGTGSYTYAWAPSGGTASTASGLGAGTYTCTVTDANLCTKTTAINITAPTALTATVSSSTMIACNGGANGAASILAGGGTPNYTYTWAPTGGNSATATSLTAATYTCTVTDAHSCTKTSTIVITQPTALTASISSISNVSCFGGSNGSATITAGGGTPSYSYSWAPSGGTAANAISLTASIYTCTVTDANLCTKTTTVNITQPSFVDVIANASSTNLCNGNILTLFGSNSASDPNYTYTWTSGVTNNTPLVATTTTTYTVTGANSSGCTDQGTIAITVNNNNDLALATINNTNSIAGSACITMQQIDGQTEVYTNASCASMASIFDQAGGNNLGNVNVCIDVTSAVQTYNGEPYSPRVYTITPTNQGPATITLYYTHEDILKLNNYITTNQSPYPILNYPNAVPQNGDQITNASITKVSGGPLGVGTGAATPILLTYNATKHAWIATFAVSSFSSFYLHSSNFGNAALPVDLISFQGYDNPVEQSIHWTVNHEENIAQYILEHSILGVQFEEIAVKDAYSLTQPKTTFSYSQVNKNIVYGHNYYRLKSKSVDGEEAIISQVIDVLHHNAEETHISYWPNPVNDVLHLEVMVKEDMDLQIQCMDITGRIINEGHLSCTKGTNSKSFDLSGLKEGTYWLKISGSNMETKTFPITLKR